VCYSALPPGWRVVARGEVEGTPHPVHPTPAGGGFWWLAIPEVCPPGEGMVLEIDKIFWDRARLRSRDEVVIGSCGRPLLVAGTS
jgi:hypothetical protein